MTLRLLAATCITLTLAGTSALAAPTSQKATAPPASETRPSAGPQPEWTEADSKALREREEARQRTWDRKMKELTGSICTGC
jgi:hypothetical protein